MKHSKLSTGFTVPYKGHLPLQHGVIIADHLRSGLALTSEGDVLAISIPRTAHVMTSKSGCLRAREEF
jgi:hypothetical protein